MSETKILLISDTHGFHENLERVVDAEAPFDLVLHMGDTESWDPVIRDILGMPFEAVAGNCDWASDSPVEKMIEIRGVRIFMTHGHEYYVNTGMGVFNDHAVTCGCQVALFGHTHRPYLQERDGILIANPGSISRPRQFDKRPSYGVLTIDDGGTPFIEIRYVD